MSKMKKWFKDKVVTMAIALSNVEKNVLGQEGKSLGESSNTEARHSQGTLADSLVRGELTQEVKDLRWRMYKVLESANNLRIRGKYVGDDEDNQVFEYKKETINIGENLKKISLDDSDPYELELLFDNKEITISGSDALENYFSTVSSKDYFASMKSESGIKILRSFYPKFLLENYTSKLAVRKISDSSKLLEFYVSKYPDEYNTNSKLFIKEIQKEIKNKNSNSFEIDEVGFITDKTAGAKDLLFYGYKVTGFDKITEFDGYYVIKFFAEVTINGDDLVKEYIETELEKKYTDKAPRKRKR